jgi:DNA-binding transcriptional regulator YiaG
MRMTPTELLEAAKALNPEKFKLDPEQTILEAYRVQEAIELMQSQVSGSQELPPKEPERATNNSQDQFQLDPEIAISRLREFVEKGTMKRGKIAHALGVSPGSMSAWLLGRWKPAPRMVETIHRFLNDARP